VFDTLVDIYIERAADDEMCIYCLGVMNFFIFSFYIFVTPDTPIF